MVRAAELRSRRRARRASECHDAHHSIGPHGQTTGARKPHRKKRFPTADVWLGMKRLAETEAAGADARRATRSETKAEEGGDARRELQ